MNLLEVVYRLLMKYAKKDSSLAANATKSITLCLLDESIILLEEVSRIVWLDKEHLPTEWEVLFFKFL